MPHIHPDLDYTVEVFVVHHDKVLLRKHDKYKIWLGVGGHIEHGEDPVQAAIREVKEEVGLDILFLNNYKTPFFRMPYYQELIPPQFVNRHRINDTHEHVSLVYFARSFTEVLHPSETEVSEECRWFTENELHDKKYGLLENVEFYAREALNFV
jgi:8-oxo-dGTP diphosphatase